MHDRTDAPMPTTDPRRVNHPAFHPEHPQWCSPAHCEGAEAGAHLAAPTTMTSTEDDVVVHVSQALWPDCHLHDKDVVLLEVRSNAFPDEHARGFLSADEAAYVALSLLAAAAKVAQR